MLKQSASQRYPKAIFCLTRSARNEITPTPTRIINRVLLEQIVVVLEER